MLRTITMADAQVHFSQLIADVCDGAEVIIARGATPVARVTPIAQAATRNPSHQHQASLSEDARWAQTVAAISRLRKRAVIGPPLSMDEILSARDEGRR